MFRGWLFRGVHGKTDEFEWRGGDISRVEGLSDAVFAFAFTLLVVSLQVPASFDELLITMRGFFAFTICFTILMWIWYHHYIYFRRYGLVNPYTITLNSLLLFVVIFYIYPLKFLFNLLIDAWFGFQTDTALSAMIRNDQVRELMMIYSLGFFAVFLIFFLLHHYAYKQRETLQLNPYETFLTRVSMQTYQIYMFIALVSVILALVNWVAISGFIYGLLGPVRTVHGIITGKKLKKIGMEQDLSPVVK